MTGMACQLLLFCVKKPAPSLTFSFEHEKEWDYSLSPGSGRHILSFDRRNSIMRDPMCRPFMKTRLCHAKLSLLLAVHSYPTSLSSRREATSFHDRYMKLRTRSCKPRAIWRLSNLENPMQNLTEGRSNTPSLPNTQDPLHNRGKKGIKLEKTRRKKEHHLWKRKTTSGSAMKARLLVYRIISASNVKEEIYGALDEWVAFEEEFPLVAAKKAIKYLKKQGQWQRIIQISKWMLSKGQGITFSTYDDMLKAYDMDSRLEEAKVYAQMEEVEVKPDEGTVKKVAQIYQKLGMIENVEKLALNYPEIREYCYSVAKD
eukprot:c26262_g1_i2 orf=50-994(+)